MKYSLEFRPSILKSLKRFPKHDLVRLKNKIKGLANNLLSTKITKMKDDNPFHKVLSGNYRIIYEIHENKLVILVVKVGHRKDVYKNIKL